MPITGPSAGIAGPVSFSDDGETIYAPITEIGGVNKLLAVSVNGNAASPSLSLSGTCPGTVTATVTGVTPGASVQIYGSKAAGSTTITTGDCAGTVLDLRKARRLGRGIADGNGMVVINLSLSAQRCGLLMQALDLGVCATSNVADAP